MRTRFAGWWGIAFVVLLLVSAVMVSLPTSHDTDATISAFYRDHLAVIVMQQVIGALALVPFVAFALALQPNRWLRPAVILFVVVELATNIAPLVIVTSGSAARPLTFVEDFADATLFIAIAIFVVVSSLDQPLWLRVFAYIVAAGCGVRAVISLLGTTALDVIAPLAFVALMLVLSVRLLARRPAPTELPSR